MLAPELQNTGEIDSTAAGMADRFAGHSIVQRHAAITARDPLAAHIALNSCRSQLFLPDGELLSVARRAEHDTSTLLQVNFLYYISQALDIHADTASSSCARQREK